MWSVRQRAIGACAGLIMCTMASAPTSPAWADPGHSTKVEVVPADRVSDGVRGLTADVIMVMKRQDKARRVVDAIRAAAKQSGAGGADGIAGISGEASGGGLHLYWRGAVPAEVTMEIEKARVDGVSVSVAAAPYTEDQLLAEADRLSRRPLFVGQRTGQRAMIVYPRTDGSGIRGRNRRCTRWAQ